MKIRKFAAVFLVLIIIIGMFTGCNKQNTLKLSIKKGDKFKVTTTINRKMSMKIMEQDLDVDQNNTIGYIYEVTDIDKDEIITVNVKYDYMAVKQTSQTGTVEYDSRKESDKNSSLSKQYDAIIGQQFIFKMDSEGKIKGLEGIDKLINGAQTKYGNLDPEEMISLNQSLKENFGEEAMNEALSEMLDIYPGKKVHTGDTWEKNLEIKYGIPMKISSTMKLKESSKDTITIDVDSSVSNNLSTQQQSASGVQMSYDVSGSEKGTLKLYKSNGFIKEGNLTQDLSGTVNMGLALVQGDTPQAMEVPVKIISTITYDTVKQ